MGPVRAGRGPGRGARGGRGSLGDPGREVVLHEFEYVRFVVCDEDAMAHDVRLISVAGRGIVAGAVSDRSLLLPLLNTVEGRR